MLLSRLSADFIPLAEETGEIHSIGRGDTGDSSAVQREINQILEVARQRNTEVGITGALMFNSDCFAQVLDAEAK